MKIPPHIAERIRRTIAELGEPDRMHIDGEAKAHGAIALMGTIGSTWLLRPDGTFWDVDSDWGKPLQPLPEEQQIDALVFGTERYPWLAELLPERPDDASSCPFCDGRVWIGAEGTPRRNCLLCPTCHGLGWV